MRPKFADDGTVTLPLTRTKAAKIRTPTIGELKDLIGAHDDVSRQIQDRAHRIQTKQSVLRNRLTDLDEQWRTRLRDADPDARVELADRMADDKEQLRHQISDVEDGYTSWKQGLWTGWVMQVLDMLVDGDMPEDVTDDDLPAYVGEADFAAKLIRHWQTVPLDSGGR